MRNRFLKLLFLLETRLLPAATVDKLTSRSPALAANVDCCLSKSCSGLQCIAAEIS